jgi:hypothetical protein
VSNQRPAPGAANSEGRLKNILKALGAILGALAAVATIATLALDVWNLEDDRQRSSAPSSPTDSAPPATATAGSFSDVEAGTCLTASLDLVTRCDVEHGYEIFSLSDCSEDSLIEYLGGNPAVDIIRAGPQRVEMAGTGTSACVVSPPEGAAGDSPAAGVLQGDLDDAWRTCIDDRTGEQDVSCADPHTAEWVSLTPPSDEAVDCEEMAARYMNAPPSRFAGELQVRSSLGPAGPQCLVASLGSDVLHGSLRNIGVSSLPLG